MATKPRDWPDNAKTARDQSAEIAAKGRRVLLPVIFDDRPMTEAEVSRRVSIAIDCFNTVLRHMERQGAPTLPEEE